MHRRQDDERKGRDHENNYQRHDPSHHQNLGSDGMAQSIAKPCGGSTCLPAKMSSQ